MMRLSFFWVGVVGYSEPLLLRLVPSRRLLAAGRPNTP